MIPNPGAFVRMNFIFFRNRLLNLAVSLMRHRANRASTPYCQVEAISHAKNVANVKMLPMPNWGAVASTTGAARGDARLPAQRSRGRRGSGNERIAARTVGTRASTYWRLHEKTLAKDAKRTGEHCGFSSPKTLASAYRNCKAYRGPTSLFTVR